MNAHEILQVDMGAAWQSARALQVESGYENGQIVVVEDDKDAFWLTEVNIKEGTGRIFRQGHPDRGEKVWVSREVQLPDVVTLSNITHAMALHSNRDAHIVDSGDDVTNILATTS